MSWVKLFFMFLLHACCADCALKLITAAEKDLKLSDDQIILFFYNPNIYPRSEYLARLAAMKKVFADKHKIIIPNYQPKDYWRELRKIKETGGDVFLSDIRCPHCWQLRLAKTFSYARDQGFDIVSSTLLASIYQDTEMIQGMVEQLSRQFNLEYYLPENITHTHFKGFYKHTFCGCAYSLLSKVEKKMGENFDN